MIIQIICGAVVLYGLFFVGRSIFNFIKDTIFDIKLTISSLRKKPYQYTSGKTPEEIQQELTEEWARGEGAIELAIAEKLAREKYKDKEY